MTLRSRIMTKRGFPGKESACQRRRWGLSPWLGRSSGEGNSSPHLSCLGNPTGRGAWLAIVHRVAKDADTTLQPNDDNTMTNSLIQSLRVIGITGNGLIQSSNTLVFLKTTIPLLKMVCFHCGILSAIPSYTLLHKNH